MPWDDDLSDTSSPQYSAAVYNLSLALTTALTSTNSYTSSLASQPQGVTASVQVTQLRQGINNTIVCFGYGMVVGNGSSGSLPSLNDIQTKLDGDSAVVSQTVVDDVYSPNTDACAYAVPSSSTTGTPGRTSPSNHLPPSTSQAFSTSPSPSMRTTSPMKASTTRGNSSTTSSAPSSTVASTSTPTSANGTHSPTPTKTPSSTSTLSSSTLPPRSSTIISPTTSMGSRSTIRPQSTLTPASTHSSSSGTPIGTSSRSPTSTVTTSKGTTTSSGSTLTPTESSFSAQTTSSLRTSSSSAVTSTIPRSSTLPSTHPSSSTPSPSPGSSSSTSAASFIPTTPTTSPKAIATTAAAFTTSTTLPSRTTKVSTTTSSTTSTTQPSTERTLPSSSTTTSATSPTPNFSTSTPTTAWTTSPCDGVRKYDGDIAVALELTSDTDSNAVETFVTTLLTYAGNPYSFSPGVLTSAAASGYILVPYPNTAFYSPTNQYGVLRESDLNVSLTAYNKLLSIQPEYGAAISDAFDFILDVNRRSQFRAVVLVGVSDAFVLQAEKEAAALDTAGYEIFTVSIGTANFSALSTDGSHAFQHVDPSSTAEAVGIASQIGARLVSESSSCFYSSLAPPTATPSTIKHTSISPQATTPRYCTAPIIQQDIAFVVEVSTSSGSLDESHAASTFITQYLISQTAFDDQHSNFAIVPFPDPSSYEISGGLQDFGNLRKSEFVITFQMIYSVYPTLDGYVSDINSGLEYTSNYEFPKLTDSRNRTILLFANSASGVQAAVDRASQLKADGVVILTVGVGDSDVDLQPLSTSPLDVWNLSTTDVSSYSATAASIISRLMTYGGKCSQWQ